MTPGLEPSEGSIRSGSSSRSFFSNYLRGSLNRARRSIGGRQQEDASHTSCRTAEGRVFERTVSQATDRAGHRGGAQPQTVPEKQQGRPAKGKSANSGIPQRLQYFLDERKIEFLRQQFHEYDTDASGAISVKELQVFLKDYLGVVMDIGKLVGIVESISPSQSRGTLTFEEFVLVWYQYCSEKESKDKIIQMAFEFLDRDQSKSISVEEFTEAMTTVGDPLTAEECRLFYQLLEKGKRQEIDEAEFVSFMKEHLDAPMPKTNCAKGGEGGVVQHLLRYLTML
mmetsp:Transcript_28862/g.68957  ORF Transcript_28862/g.68957 Transcript_28862/m.68957 type:complete len:283 (+) Transcript_28862:191-1039(+)